MSYNGQERRVHKVFITRNREYHVRCGVCVAVRDLKSGVWISGHEAIGMELEVDYPGDYFVDRTLLFLSAQAKVRTSRVKQFIRPKRETLATYRMLWAICPEQG